MSDVYGPRWPGLDDVRHARSAAAWAGPPDFEARGDEMEQTQDAYFAGVSHVIAKRQQAAAETEPEAG